MNLYTDLKDTLTGSEEGDDLQEKEASPFESILEWEILERAWKPRARLWYLNWSLIFLVVMAVAARLNPIPYIFLLLVLSFAFLWFVNAAVKPRKVTHSITPLGFKAFEKLYKWKNITGFWFSQKGGFIFLNAAYWLVFLPETHLARYSLYLQFYLSLLRLL
jgi:hypothetical protein